MYLRKFTVVVCTQCHDFCRKKKRNVIRIDLHCLNVLFAQSIHSFLSEVQLIKCLCVSSKKMGMILKRIFDAVAIYRNQSIK